MVSVFDQGQAVLDGHTVRPYIVMEYVEGPTLRDLILREAPMAPARALEVFEPVLAALAAAHDAGLVHRDVKPENVLISDRGPDQGGRLRAGQGGLLPDLHRDAGPADRHGVLPAARARGLGPGRRALGRLQRRRGALRAADRPQAAHRRDPDPGGLRPRPHRRAGAVDGLPSGRIPPYLDALVTGATARDADPGRTTPGCCWPRSDGSAALRDGGVDDPELTQDLSALRTGAADPPPWPARPRRADAEPTQLVAPDRAPTSRPGRRPRRAPGPSAAERRLAPRRPWSATPGPRRRRAERVAAQRERQARKRRRGRLAVLLVLLLTTWPPSPAGT